MKKALLLAALISPLALVAQQKITAETIFRQIDEGNEIVIEDAFIVGTLDFTELSNQKKSNSNDHEFKSSVRQPITFINCVFTDDVIAYKSVDFREKGRSSWQDNDTFSTDFTEAVRIENCEFRGKSEFKYSTFSEAANFEGTIFREEANFKYAQFKELSGFGNCTFYGEANFKYANFDQDADFYHNHFNGYANFKYSRFGDRVTFKKADFDSEADFKYAKISNEAIFTDARFSSEPDFKYANGKRYMN